MNSIDTVPLRQNFLCLLREKQPGDEQTQLQEKVALRDTARELEELLRTERAEETFQKFIERSPIVLTRFAPRRIFFKRPILSKFKTDFAIHTHRNELILVELERPEMPLLTGIGQIHSQLQHALTQVLDWFREIENHRAAVLEGIGLDPRQVSKISGVVIGGRDPEGDNLNTFRWHDFARGIRVLTFDDLLRDLAVLSRNLGQLAPPSQRIAPRAI